MYSFNAGFTTINNEWDFNKCTAALNHSRSGRLNTSYNVIGDFPWYNLKPARDFVIQFFPSSPRLDDLQVFHGRFQGLCWGGEEKKKSFSNYGRSEKHAVFVLTCHLQ